MIVAQDSFAKANQAGWGSAQIGGAWSLISGAGTLNIASNEGTITGSGTFDFVRLGAGIDNNIDGVVRIKLGAANDFAGLLLRLVDSSNHYRLDFDQGDLSIERVVSGVQTTIATSHPPTVAGSFFWIRFRASNNTLMGRVWADGTADPSLWNVITSDTTFQNGGYGLYGAPSSVAVISFDSFSIDSLLGGPVLPGAVIGPSITNYVGMPQASHMGPVQRRRQASPLGGRGLAGKHPFKRGFRLWRM